MCILMSYLRKKSEEIIRTHKYKVCIQSFLSTKKSEEIILFSISFLGGI